MDDAGLAVAVGFGEALRGGGGLQGEGEGECGAALGERLVQEQQHVQGDYLPWLGEVDRVQWRVGAEQGLDEEEVHNVWRNASEEGDVVFVASEWMALGTEEVLFFVRVCGEECLVHSKRYTRRIKET